MDKDLLGEQQQININPLAIDPENLLIDRPLFTQNENAATFTRDG